jgi:hypothetical protein
LRSRGNPQSEVEGGEVVEQERREGHDLAFIQVGDEERRPVSEEEASLAVLRFGPADVSAPFGIARILAQTLEPLWDELITPAPSSPM